jgi:hypothetical protein
MTDEFTIGPDDILALTEAQTLSGDIRDALLMHVRSIKVPWTMLAEDEQQMAIDAISTTAESAVRRIVGLVATGDMPHVVGKVQKFTVKTDLKIELQVANLVTNICALAEHGSGNAVLVLADADQFLGERAPAKPDPDQPPLPMGKAA